MSTLALAAAAALLVSPPQDGVATDDPLARAEEVATEVTRALKALDASFFTTGDPLAGDGAEELFDVDARSVMEPEDAPSPRAWVTGPAGRPVTVERRAEVGLVLDPSTGREDAVDDVRVMYAAIERDLGGRPTRAAEIKAKAVTPAPDAGPDSWDLRFRVRHVRRAPGEEATQTKSIWQVRVTIDGDRLALLGWAGAVVEAAQLAADPVTSGFVDVAGTVLTGDRAGWLGPSIMDLRDALDVDVGVGILGHHGVAVADVNGDGFEDLYLCQPGGIPNQLWLRQDDGTAVEAARAGGLDLVDATTSALFVDLDGDGDRDVVLGVAYGVVVLVRTEEGYRESARFERTGVTSLAAADVNLDGRVDVYACAYANPYDGSTFPVPYHDAENGQRNMLLVNVSEARDRLVFGDATIEAGLDDAGARFSFAASFEDVDDDGDPDLYVANDFGRNALYLNDGSGRFVNRAPELRVEDVAAGMAAAFGDIDGDGRVDLYVSNMESSAGRRVTGQEIFRADTDENTRALFRRHAKGNTLYLQTEEGTFRETDLATAGQWAWGSIPIDLDGNGRLDLFVPNGFVTGTDTKAPDL